MARQVLQSTCRTSQCHKFLPLTAPPSLHVFAIDATTLASLFCSKSAVNTMVIRTFKSQVMQQQQVDSHKNAVFSDFFNLEQLRRLCKQHCAKFASGFCILPDLKTVRVYGGTEGIC